MKILLAGGAGFLGSHLSEALVSLGNSIDIVDNLVSGSLTNLSSIESEVRFYKTDVCEFKTDESYDLVINFASRASRVEWENKPVEVALSNSLGSVNLIKIAMKSGARYIYASSSEIYGDPEVIPTPEDYIGRVSTTGSRSPYDEGKRFGEAITKAYEREFGLNATILRFFNTHGPRMRGDDFYGRVVDRFVKQAIEGRPITVYGDGKQTRSFTFVSDTVEGVIKVIEKGQTGEIYNIGNDREISVNELARIVKEETASKSKLVYLPLPENDPSRRSADISKMKAMGWVPKVSLGDGIKIMANYYREIGLGKT